ncbi:hypothetical protein CALVIDRAFT_222804 [Calocera viscosa TUFC12733]|uniref:Uncharacterized protein n=1 Tax=Calocera viscosa (strain TUFC12733) TaxID=1330018 RepID=A0A167K6M5_CALVF|nr:hypothetical protein CALVIDRAFT_222804 [Calocera viscosa TUFC12733]
MCSADHPRPDPHSEHLPLADLPSVIVAETFSTPLLPDGGRCWSYAGRLAIRLFRDDEEFRPRIYARQLGRRGRTVFDALLTHPVVYSAEPVGCSLWLEEPEEELRGWCFRFDDPLTARQFATLAAVLTADDPVIRRNVRRIEHGELVFASEDGGSRAAEGSWVSRRMSWLSTRS